MLTVIVAQQAQERMPARWAQRLAPHRLIARFPLPGASAEGSPSCLTGEGRISVNILGIYAVPDRRKDIE